MAIQFTGIGNGGARQSVTNIQVGNFTFTHSGATGANNIVWVVVAAYRTSTVPINVSVTYDGTSMASAGRTWMNGNSSSSQDAGFLEFFKLQDVTTASNRTVRVSFAASGANQFHMAANSYSYSGVTDTSTKWEEYGTSSGTYMSQYIIPTAFGAGTRIIQAFAHKPSFSQGVDVTDYSETDFGEVDAGFCVGRVGEAITDDAITFSATRSGGVDWCAIGFVMGAEDPVSVAPGSASLALTGAVPAPAVSTNTYVFPTTGALALSGGTPVARAPVLPTPAVLTLTGGIPNTDVLGVTRPVAAMLNLTPSTPMVRIGIKTYPAGASLSLTAGLPVVRPGVAAIPDAATLTIAGSVPSIGYGLAVIPASATVLSLVGMNFDLWNYMPNQLQGRFAFSPYTMQKVDYPASLKITSIAEGVVALNNAIRATSGQKIVLAHSQGAQVASRWMRQYDSDGTAPGPTELMFILTGNPLRSTGGYLTQYPEIGGEIGIPTPQDTKWWIVDVARRWDGWADWVTDEEDAIAVANAEAGKSAHHADPAYNDIDIYDPSHTVWNSGNTTFILTNEERPPILKNWRLLGDQGDALALAYERHIEKTYTNRPDNDPEIIVDPQPNTFWTKFLQKAGVDYS